MKDILDLYASGSINIEEAKSRLYREFYTQGEDFQLDLHRGERLGFPEVILAEGKSVDQVLTICSRLLETSHLVIISAMRQEHELALRSTFVEKPIAIAGSLMAIGEKKEPADLGTAGIITAGTSDVPYAQETGLTWNTLEPRC